MQRSALCRSRRELSNAYFLAKFGFDTAENEPCKVCPIAPVKFAPARRLAGGERPPRPRAARGPREAGGLREARRRGRRVRREHPRRAGAFNFYLKESARVRNKRRKKPTNEEDGPELRGIESSFRRLNATSPRASFSRVLAPLPVGYHLRGFLVVCLSL